MQNKKVFQSVDSESPDILYFVESEFLAWKKPNLFHPVHEKRISQWHNNHLVFDVKSMVCGSSWIKPRGWVGFAVNGSIHCSLVRDTKDDVCHPCIRR